MNNIFNKNVDLNSSNLLWIALIIICLVMLYNNYCDNNKMEGYNNMMQHTQEHLKIMAYNDDLLNHSMEKIVKNDHKIKNKMRGLDIILNPEKY